MTKGSKRPYCIGIIPARMASSRFPGKPLAKICGIPMVGHVYYRSKLSPSLEEVYIATCDNEVMAYASAIGCKAVMTADTHERASDRTQEAMLSIERLTGRRSDIVVMIQGDEPLIHPEMIDMSIMPFIEDESVNVVNLMSVVGEEEQRDPNSVKVVCDLKNDALYFSREALPSKKKAGKIGVKVYRQICIIPFRRDFLLKFGQLPPTPLERIESVDMLRIIEHGYKVRMVETGVGTQGVDTPSDLEKAEEIMRSDSVFERYRNYAPEVV